MQGEFVIARNPEEGSTLPYLVRLPVGPSGIVLKVRETWPRTAKVYCHPSPWWPEEPEIVERVPVRSCVRRGAAIDLVLDRGREHRSQFVFARARGREVIFWQSARTAKQARPSVSVPTRRASGQVLEILVDSHERYPWRFTAQQAIRYLLADLAALPRAALVVEDRYSAVFKLERVRPGVVAEALAEAQVRFPNVPIVFAETRPLAQEWTYRFLGAAVAHLESDEVAADRADALTGGSAPPPAPPSTAEVRAWAVAQGLPVAAKGRLRPEVLAAYAAAHP